jgi:hypothetical protein
LERVRLVSKLTGDEIAEYLSYLRAKDVTEFVSRAQFPALCPPIQMTTPLLP